MSGSPFEEAVELALALIKNAPADADERDERAALIAELERLESRRGTTAVGAPKHDLMAVICHDLRAPLSSILMGAAFLQRSLGSDPKGEPMRRIADAIVRSGERMNTLVHDLHDLTHMEQGRFRIEPRPHEAASLLDAALQRLAPAAATKSVTLEKQNDAGTAAVSCDGERVLQVFAKLVENALRHTPPAGTIRLSATNDPKGVRFTVTDNGTGMGADRVAHAFDRVWHASQSPREGTGLGLALSHGIVVAHGGGISVESPTGVGTTVAFTLLSA